VGLLRLRGRLVYHGGIGGYGTRRGLRAFQPLLLLLLLLLMSPFGPRGLWAASQGREIFNHFRYCKRMSGLGGSGWRTGRAETKCCDSLQVLTNVPNVSAWNEGRNQHNGNGYGDLTRHLVASLGVWLTLRRVTNL